MPPMTHLRPPLGRDRPNSPEAHEHVDQVAPALEKAGTRYTVGQPPVVAQGSTMALPVPGKERPTEQPTTGARQPVAPSTPGLNRVFGHLFSGGTQDAGTHGMIAPGATAPPSYGWTPPVVSINTFRLSPEPWDTQYVAGVVNGDS